MLDSSLFSTPNAAFIITATSFPSSTTGPDLVSTQSPSSTATTGSMKASVRLLSVWILTYLFINVGLGTPLRTLNGLPTTLKPRDPPDPQPLFVPVSSTRDGVSPPPQPEPPRHPRRVHWIVDRLVTDGRFSEQLGRVVYPVRSALQLGNVQDNTPLRIDMVYNTDQFAPGRLVVRATDLGVEGADVPIGRATSGEFLRTIYDLGRTTTVQNIDVLDREGGTGYIWKMFVRNFLLHMRGNLPVSVWGDGTTVIEQLVQDHIFAPNFRLPAGLQHVVDGAKEWSRLAWADRPVKAAHDWAFESFLPKDEFSGFERLRHSFEAEGGVPGDVVGAGLLTLRKDYILEPRSYPDMYIHPEFASRLTPYTYLENPLTLEGPYEPNPMTVAGGSSPPDSPRTSFLDRQGSDASSTSLDSFEAF